MMDDNDTPRAKTVKLGFQFTTKYNEQSGLLSASNLGQTHFECEEGKYYSDYMPHIEDDEDGWTGVSYHDLEKTEDGVSTSDLKKGTPVHVLFHFHDNYCDCAFGFLHLGQAQRKFLEEKEDCHEKVEEWRNYDPNGYDYCLVKHDKWHCDVLECELTDNYFTRGWSRPDKGDTWWLRTIVID